MKLLVDGKEAFPELINLIQTAEKSIYINMFIWRNDDIGRRIATELVNAAGRGVKIIISKDRYGAVLEYCEECRSSFFHRKPTISERFNCYVLEWFYHLGFLGPKVADAAVDKLYLDFINNPNIKVEDKINKCDHSKFYIFDNETVVLGGINIEDKELTTDWRGLSYHDYMVEITEQELVNEFIKMTMDANRPTQSMRHFTINRKLPKHVFEMRDSYLQIINNAEKTLTIVMAYVSTLSDFEKAILTAANRGVDINIVIPNSANFQDDLNKKFITRIVKESNGKVKSYLCPNMLHAKLVMNEKTISLGSCNITKKAFKKLDELNLITDNDDFAFAKSVRDSVVQTIEESNKFTKDVRYNSFRAFCESIIM